MNDTVRSPESRERLIAALKALSDPEFQQRVWIEGESDAEGKKADSFDYAVELLFDYEDYSIPERCIGWNLVSEDERASVMEIITSVEKTCGPYVTKPFERYAIRAGWADVVQSARAALVVFGVDDN